MGREKTRQPEPTVRLCAEVDFADHFQVCLPNIFGGCEDVVDLVTTKAGMNQVKESLKHGKYKKTERNSVILENGLELPSFVLLPSVVCACEIDNVEVTNTSIIFNCDRLQLCVEYIVCMKLFDKDNHPQCEEFKACFTKQINREDFDYLPPFSNQGGGVFGIELEDFLSAEGACVNVEPLFEPDACFVLNLGCLSAIVLLFPFEVLVKLFRTHNVTLPLGAAEDVGPRVARLPKVVDRCNACFAAEIPLIGAQRCKK